MKTRIIKEDGVFKIQRKNWFWGWRTITCGNGSIDGLTWEEDVTFKSKEDALKFIGIGLPEIEIVWP